MNRMMGRNLGSLGLVALAISLGSSSVGCDGDAMESTPANDPSMLVSFDEFEATTPRELGTGAYLIEGDIPVWSKEDLRSHYESLKGQSATPVTGVESADGIETVHAPLAVMTNASGLDVKWGPTQQLNVTFCVSTTFGANYSAVVEAMQNAHFSWRFNANIVYTYLPFQDENCTASNNNVTFDVRPTSGQSYKARSFLPSDARANRNILINSTAFTDLAPPLTLAGLLRHEVGHTLGFRHEHTTGAASSTTCYEDQNWRSITGYDENSVMHYPWCAGNPNTTLDLTAMDVKGASCLYGPPPGQTVDCSYRGVLTQAHVSGLGWLPQVRNNNLAGTVGQSRSSQAYTIQMFSVGNIFICYEAHVAGLGWLGEVCNGTIAGTVGQSRGLQAIKIRLVNAPAGCSVVYQAHVGGIGWQAPVSNNAVAGTTGQSRDIQALKVATSGSCGF
jgi:hypothetical protein